MIWLQILYKPTKLWGVMSLNVRFLDFHSDFFPENLEAVGDKHRATSPGHLHHETAVQYRDNWSPGMPADCCCSLRRDVPQAQYNKIYAVTFQVTYILSVI